MPRCSAALRTDWRSAAVTSPSAHATKTNGTKVKAAIDDGDASIEVSFDPDTGALQRFFVDVDERMADEEFGIEVISLTTE